MDEPITHVMEMYWETCIGDLDRVHAVICPQCITGQAILSLVWTDSYTGDEHLSAHCPCGWSDTKELDERAISARYRVRKNLLSYVNERMNQ